jgi:hypothetical protein
MGECKVTYLYRKVTDDVVLRHETGGPTRDCHVALSDWPIMAKGESKWLGLMGIQPMTSKRIFHGIFQSLNYNLLPMHHMQLLLYKIYLNYSKCLENIAGHG